MDSLSKYNVDGHNQSELQAGSKNVLKNKLGLTESSQINKAESFALIQATDLMIRRFGQNHSFTSKDLCWMHAQWLGSIYEWAGQYRTIDTGKGDVWFAHAAFIPDQMKDFDKNYLRTYTPCKFTDIHQLASALAIVHVEFIVIHPFREGNGRLARILATLMAAQAGINLSYESLDNQTNTYIDGIKAGFSKNYSLIQRLFTSTIKNSLG